MTTAIILLVLFLGCINIAAYLLTKK